MQISSSISIWSTNYIPVVSASGVSYLLDDYPASAAYSLRQLKSTEVDVVRVRRSSDNAESNFNPTEITDGTLTAWTGANNGFVVTWYDQAGVKNLTQSTAANQPRLVSSGTVILKNGLPAVNFDGSNDFIDNFSGTVLNTTNATVMTVSTNTLAADLACVATHHNGGNKTIRLLNDARVGGLISFGVTNTSSTQYYANLSTSRAAGTQLLQIGIIDSSKNMSAFDNGATGGTDTYTGTTNSNGIKLGSQYLSGSILQGSIQEYIAWNSDQSSNRTAIETNINDHYSIY
jgi:hypothetical protein